MRRLVTVPALVALVVALVPTAALAKGASEAAISGPGLAKALELAGEGQPGAEQLERIAFESGFYPAVFEQTPDPMRDTRPDAALGPRYVVRYAMPGPNGELDTIVQDVYPYASPTPMTYVEPGQSYWSTEETRGGWFVAPTILTDLLVEAGLPETPPTDVGTQPSDSPWHVVLPIAVLAALAIVAAGLVTAVVRRRPQPA
jgi:hypothetical protein